MARMFKNKANTTCKAKSIDVVEDKTHRASLATLLDTFPDAQGFTMTPVTDGHDPDDYTTMHPQPYIDRSALEIARSTVCGSEDDVMPSDFADDGAQASRTNVLAEAVDDTVTEAQSIIVPTNTFKTTRTRQPPKRRGRPSEVQRRYEQPIVFETFDDASIDTLPEDAMPKIAQKKSFFMREEEKVKAFLLGHIEKIHQLSDKKLAKAWIKGICPKKQAHFPYKNKQREKDTARGPVVPGWWPPTELCAFIEPDHITRGPRNELLLHLLRLRPSVEQLRFWNHDKCEPHHIHRTVGWTAFLKDVAPVDSLDEITPTTDERVEYRRRLLREMYDIAEKEEMYYREGMDEQYQYDDNYKPPSTRVSKRSRRAVSEATDCEDGPYVSSRSASPSSSSRACSKRPRRESLCSDAKPLIAADQLDESMIAPDVADRVMTEPEAARPEISHEDVVMETPPANHPATAIEEPLPNAQPAASDLKPRKRRKSTTAGRRAVQRAAAARLQRRQAGMQQHWQAVSAPEATPFDPGMSSAGIAFDTYGGHVSGYSMFPGNHNYAFPQAPYQHPPQPQAQRTAQVYRAAYAEPQFEPINDAPMFSPTKLEYPQNTGQCGQYDVSAACGYPPASRSMLPPQQGTFEYPVELHDQALLQHIEPQYLHQQPFGTQQNDPQRHIGAVLPLEYAQLGPRMQFGGLPLSFARYQ